MGLLSLMKKISFLTFYPEFFDSALLRGFLKAARKSANGEDSQDQENHRLILNVTTEIVEFSLESRLQPESRFVPGSFSLQKNAYIYFWNMLIRSRNPHRFSISPGKISEAMQKRAFFRKIPPLGGLIFCLSIFASKHQERNSWNSNLGIIFLHHLKSIRT